ncbi:MAG: hypothetical protein HDT39_17240 [Lachnospiraceae bacterium]|nr:hypothetical protein [Lachnospiraceae bacterium]
MKVENKSVSSKEVNETLKDANKQIRDRSDIVIDDSKNVFFELEKNLIRDKLNVEDFEIYCSWTEKDKQAFNSLLSHEQIIYFKAIEKEPDITNDLKIIVQSNGGELVGLEYRIKSPSSLYEKIYDRAEKVDISEINDLIRYTEVKVKDDLIECTQNTLSELEKKGYIVTKIKNTWLDEKNPYNGINVQLESQEGQKFELQFHTPESFELKNSQEMHGLYEQARVLIPGTEEYLEIED